jgi:hypothetical protein
MAKRRVSKKMSPAVTRLWFHITPGQGYNFIDLSLAASAANRRFYRQGTTWAVAGMSLHAGEGITGVFDVSKVPETWVAKNAHQKSKSLWMKSQDQVLDDQPSIAAKYRDFKISIDDDMSAATLQDATANPATNGEIMLPVDRQNFTAKIGEWTYSTIQLPTDGGSAAPDEILLHMVGADVGTAPNISSVGMIHGYGLSRSRPQLIEPNTPTTGGWMNDVFDVADLNDEIRLDVTDNNDVPPYRVGDDTSSDEFYPGGVNNQPSTALHAVSYVTGTTVGGKSHVQGGMFGCGLIRFDWDLVDKNAIGSMYLSVDLVPGGYKGYLTEVY